MTASWSTSDDSEHRGVMETQRREKIVATRAVAAIRASRLSDGISIDHPEPASVALPPGDLGGHVAIGKARRGESEVAADQGRPLLPHRKFSSRSDDLDIEGTNGLFASDEPSAAAVDHRVGFEQCGHAIDVAGVLSRYQEALEVLGIVDRLSPVSIVHDDARREALPP